MQMMLGSSPRVAVQDPSYPVYVDTSVIMGMTGDYDQEATSFSNVQYMPCTPENGFFPDLSVVSSLHLALFGFRLRCIRAPVWERGNLERLPNLSSWKQQSASLSWTWTSWLLHTTVQVAKPSKSPNFQKCNSMCKVLLLCAMWLRWCSENYMLDYWPRWLGVSTSSLSAEQQSLRGMAYSWAMRITWYWLHDVYIDYNSLSPCADIQSAVVAHSIRILGRCIVTCWHRRYICKLLYGVAVHLLLLLVCIMMYSIRFYTVSPILRRLKSQMWSSSALPTTQLALQPPERSSPALWKQPRRMDLW